MKNISTSKRVSNGSMKFSTCWDYFATAKWFLWFSWFEIPVFCVRFL